MTQELRDRLDEGEEVNWAEISVFVTAALLKDLLRYDDDDNDDDDDLLRSLPDCLLMCESFTSWTEASAAFQADSKLETLKR